MVQSSTIVLLDVVGLFLKPIPTPILPFPSVCFAPLSPFTLQFLIVVLGECVYIPSAYPFTEYASISLSNIFRLDEVLEPNIPADTEELF